MDPLPYNGSSPISLVWGLGGHVHYIELFWFRPAIKKMTRIYVIFIWFQPNYHPPLHNDDFIRLTFMIMIMIITRKIMMIITIVIIIITTSLSWGLHLRLGLCTGTCTGAIILCHFSFVKFWANFEFAISTSFKWFYLLAVGHFSCHQPEGNIYLHTYLPFICSLSYQ